MGHGSSGGGRGKAKVRAASNSITRVGSAQCTGVMAEPVVKGYKCTQC